MFWERLFCLGRLFQLQYFEKLSLTWGQRELQIANLCATWITSDKPVLTQVYSVSLVWQGVTVLWPHRLYSSHLYLVPWPHRLHGYISEDRMQDFLLQEHRPPPLELKEICSCSSSISVYLFVCKLLHHMPLCTSFSRGQ